MYSPIKDGIVFDEYFATPFLVLFDKKYRFKLFKGGRGSAKSQHLARAAVIRAIKEKTRILCVREVQTSIKESIHQLIKDIIKEYQDKYEFNEFEILNTTIRNKRNGSEFIFKGLKDLNEAAVQAIKSYEDVDICLIEEGQTLTKRSIEILIPTIRKPGSEIWAAMNEITTRDPLVVEWGTLPDAIITHVNWYENPFLPEELRAVALACKQHKPKEYGRIWLGKPSRDVVPYVVPYYSEKETKVLSGAYFDDRLIYLSCDFNVDPMMWVVIQHINNKSFYIDEIVQENTTTEDCIAIFAQRYKDHKTPIVINGDASGKNRSTQSKSNNFDIIENYLEKVGLTSIRKISRGNPSIQDRINSFNDRVLHIGARKTDDGKIVSFAERRLFVADRCKYLLKNLRELQFWPGTSEIKIPNRYELGSDPELKFMGHIFDAASYHEHYYYPIKRDRKKNNVLDFKGKSEKIEKAFDSYFEQAGRGA